MTDDARHRSSLVEDDDATRTFLADNLTADGYDAARRRDDPRRRCGCSRRSSPTSRSSTSGCRTARGWTSCAACATPTAWPRAIDPSTPLLVLSGRAGELDRVRGFERGARRLRAEAVRLSGAAAARRRAAAPRARRAAGAGGCASATLEVDPSVARGAPARRARRAVAEGVRAAARAGGRADARVHQGGAAARRLGLPVAWARRGRWTRTRAGCGRKLARRRRPLAWSTCGASATGSSTGTCGRMSARLGWMLGAAAGSGWRRSRRAVARGCARRRSWWRGRATSCAGR